MIIAKDNHLTSKTTQTHNANTHRHPESEYKIEDKIVLNSVNIRYCIKNRSRFAKFYPRYLSSFKIVDVKPESSNYKLELFPRFDIESIHAVFHARLLRPFIINDSKKHPARESPSSSPIVLEDNPYEVEKILDHDR